MIYWWKVWTSQAINHSVRLDRFEEWSELKYAHFDTSRKRKSLKSQLPFHAQKVITSTARSHPLNDFIPYIPPQAKWKEEKENLCWLGMIKYFAYRWKIACSISHPTNIFINSKIHWCSYPTHTCHAEKVVGGIFIKNKDVEVKMVLLFLLEKKQELKNCIF